MNVEVHVHGHIQSVIIDFFLKTAIPVST